MDFLNQWLRDTASKNRYEPREHLACSDGFTVSVQVGRHCYSSPREDGAQEYTEVELGFPSGPVPDYILEHAEKRWAPTSTIYPYVPVEDVEKLILLHGGIK